MSGTLHVRIAQTALERSEAAFRAVFDGALDGMVLVDDAGRFVDANPAACGLFERSIDELRTMTVHDVGGDSRSSRESLGRLIAQGTLTGTWTLPRRSGELRTLQYAARANIAPGRHLSVLRDITQERAAAAAIRTAERLLEETQQVGQVGSWSVDVTGDNVWWSNQCCRIFGVDRAPSTSAAYYEMLPPQDCADLRARVARAAEQGTPYEFEHRIVRPTGDVRWVRGRGAVESDAMGKPIRLLGTVQDVTDQRLAQDEVRRSEQVLARAFRLSPVAMSIIRKADARIIDVNDAAIELSGRSREELIGRTSSELGLWIDPSARSRMLADLEARREIRDFPVEMRHKNGDIRYARMSAETIEIGDEPCLLAVIADVTSTLSTQQELEDAQEVGKVGSWTVDLRTGAARLSSVAWRITGCAIAPQTLDEYLALVDRRDIDRVVAACDRALRDRDGFSAEYRIVHPDGAVRWVYSHARVECDANGEVARMSGSLQDITERRDAEMRLAASEERYRRIVETTSQGVLTDDGHRVTFANQRAADLLGASREALIGRPVAELFAPDAQALVASHRLRRCAGLSDTYDVPMMTASGERLLVELAATPLRDASGHVEGALMMFSDVGLRRQAEELRARLASIVESSSDAIISCALDGTVQTWNAGAERLFGYTAGEAIGMNAIAIVPPERRAAHPDLMAQLQRGEVVALETTCIRKDSTRADIVLTCSPVRDASGTVVAISSIARDISAQRHAQKMEAIGALAGGIAHDFNNILSVILSSSTLLEDAIGRHDPVIDDVLAIRDAAERAATLTRQLLAFSRRQVLEPKVVNLDRIVAGMEKMLRRLLGERVDLVMTTGHAANVMIDAGQFEQVIMNLVVNARDAMPEGGRLMIETSLVTHNDRPYAQVTVSDTGVGMDDTTRQRMFEPFFTTKERGKGTGLGLATVFGIVEQSGGFVNVDSTRGHGTTIAIFIPTTERAEAIGLTVAEPEPRDSRGETILVCEDEELVRRLVIKLLRREGYEVLGAANAGEALLIAEQRRDIDLLLTDVVMPIMNGRQLAERLRATTPGLRVVFMSGYHDDDVLREMAATAGVVHLQKPVPRDLLVQKLRELLDSR